MRILFFIALLSLALSPVSSVFAQTISTTQALAFGEAVLMDNTAAREIIVDQDGSFTSDPEYTLITTPVPGIYQLTGDAAFRAISSVTVVVDQEMIGPGGFQFTLDNFDIDHPVQTNGAGEATIRVGARMRSSGLGGLYPGGGTFTGNLTLSVNY